MPLSRSEARLVFPRHPVNGAHTCVRRRAGRPRTCVRSPCPYVHSFKHTSTSLYVARSERAAVKEGGTRQRGKEGGASRRDGKISGGSEERWGIFAGEKREEDKREGR